MNNWASKPEIGGRNYPSLETQMLHTEEEGHCKSSPQEIREEFLYLNYLCFICKLILTASLNWVLKSGQKSANTSQCDHLPSIAFFYFYKANHLIFRTNAPLNFLQVPLSLQMRLTQPSSSAGWADSVTSVIFPTPKGILISWCFLLQVSDPIIC